MCAGATVALAFAPRPLAGTILAATAGTLFEAAPFVLLASLLPARLRGFASLASCGCGGRGSPPGALAPVAVAVCWLSFGPAIAIARIVAAALLFAVRRPPARRATGAHVDAGGDATFPMLWSLAASSAATALVAPHLGGLSAEPMLAALAGLALGALVPCSTAGVAVAAGCAARDPWLAAGILTSAGIVPNVHLPRLRAPLRMPATWALVKYGRSAESGGEGDLASASEPTRMLGAAAAELARVRRADSPALRDGRFTLVLLALALTALALRGGAGLVHPRLVPFAAVAAIVAGTRAVRPLLQAGRRTAALPAIMLAALVTGSPQPPYVADEATALEGFPGEPVAFTGVAHADGAATRIVRFSITCCRLDAAALAITLDRRVAVRDGTWLRVRGRFALRDGRLVVHPAGVAPVDEPPDPFVYR